MDEGDKLLFVFDGGVLRPEQVAAIQLPPAELAEYAFVEPDDVHRLAPSRLSRRLAAAVAALHAGRTDYLQHGELA